MCPMSKLDRAQVQSIIANIDADFQPIVLSSALLAFEIREVFHVRGRLFAEKKGQFIDAADQLIKAAGLPFVLLFRMHVTPSFSGFPSDPESPPVAPLVTAETCYNDAAVSTML